MKQTRRLRELLKKPGYVTSASCWDALSAKIIEKAGFDTVAISGAAVANTMLGKTDVGYVTQTEIAQLARNVTLAVDVPVIADADDGFGSVLNTRRTIRLYEQAGLAGCHIEDMIVPKRGALTDKGGRVPPAEFANKIKAAVDARTDSDFLIIARTDNLLHIDEAIERINIYAEAGADVGMLVGTNSIEEMEKACSQTSIPLLEIQVPGIPTPVLSPKELERIGFKIVIYGFMSYAAAYAGAWEAAENTMRQLAMRTTVPDLGLGIAEIRRFEELCGMKNDLRLLDEYMSTSVQNMEE